jgi:predicted DsbA family dithiol-disulfide isomerase
VAEQDGIQADVKEAFMKAYFVDKVYLTIEENIVEIMAKYGWSEAKTKEVIYSDVASDEVKEEMNYYRQLGVSGVPFFIFNQKYAISGAQPSDVFVEIIEKVAQELEIANVEGVVCDINGENC